MREFKARRIKFRVFDRMSKSTHIVGTDIHDSVQTDETDNEIFYYNYQCGEGSITYDEELPEDNSGFILMQYTGLKDKNDKEIYEGDIVKFNAIAPMSDIPDAFIGTVEFIECAFYVTYGKQGFYLFDECHQWEIIGNIYENPELLEEEQ